MISVGRPARQLPHDETAPAPRYGLSVLPLPPPPAPIVAEADWAEAERPSGKAIQVLLVEDVAADARLVSLALRQAPGQSFAVTHVTSLGAALSALSEIPVDVVLLDLTLPDSRGVATITRLREAAPHGPVVVMTGNPDPAFAARALEAGAQDYLVKGDDPAPVVARAVRYAIMRMAAQLDREALICRLENERRALRRELDAARAMQFDLLPRPEVLDPTLRRMGLAVEACFQPSSAVGGDLWGILPCDDGRLAVFSFDFSGHGISAALNVFRLHTLMGEHLPRADDPAATLAELNACLCGLLPPGQFATIFLGVIDPVCDTLTWSAAGHPAPALLKPGQDVELLDTRGTPLGLSSAARYVNRSIRFPHGAGLFLYSDALTEACDTEGRMIGEESLVAMLRANTNDGRRLQLGALLHTLFERVNQPLDDDLTALHLFRC